MLMNLMLHVERFKIAYNVLNENETQENDQNHFNLLQFIPQ